MSFECPKNISINVKQKIRDEIQSDNDFKPTITTTECESNSTKFNDHNVDNAIAKLTQFVNEIESEYDIKTESNTLNSTSSINTSSTISSAQDILTRACQIIAMTRENDNRFVNDDNKKIDTSSTSSSSSSSSSNVLNEVDSSVDEMRIRDPSLLYTPSHIFDLALHLDYEYEMNYTHEEKQFLARLRLRARKLDNTSYVQSQKRKRAKRRFEKENEEEEEERKQKHEKLQKE